MTRWLDESAAPEEPGGEPLYMKVIGFPHDYVAECPCLVCYFLETARVSYEVSGQAELMLGLVLVPSPRAKQTAHDDAGE